jgi:hypothetical protein
VTLASRVQVAGLPDGPDRSAQRQHRDGPGTLTVFTELAARDSGCGPRTWSSPRADTARVPNSGPRWRRGHPWWWGASWRAPVTTSQTWGSTGAHG